MLNPQAGRPPLVDCPRLLIQYNCSYPPYLEAASSIHNLGTHHGMVTSNPVNMIYIIIMDIKSFFYIILMKI
jgi:hypothetical protein